MINLFEGVTFGTETIECFLSYILVILLFGIMFDFVRGVK